MRILHVISSLKIGGAEQALFQLLSRLSSCENHVAYFHSGPFLENIKKLYIPTYHVRGIAHCDPFAFVKLYNIIKRVQPDVIHSSLWFANMSSRLLGAWHDIPVVDDLHGNAVHEGAFRNWCDRQTAHMPAAHVAVSQSVYDVYKKNIIDQIKNTKKREQALNALRVIANGIDAQQITQNALENPLLRCELGLSEDAFVIGSVGRLEPIKSYDVLMKAFAALKKLYQERQIKLCLVGGGSQLENLKQLASRLGIADHVIFTGFRNDAYRFYPLFNCFALSSQSEGLSMALLEALAFGLPIVSTHLLQVHDVIVHGKHGFLVLPNDVDAFVQALLLLCRDSDLVTQIQKENQELVRAMFDLRLTVHAYQQLFYTCFNTK